MVTCAWCGATYNGSNPDEAPATWTRQSSDRAGEWLCERCTRENLRSIEGRLDSTWW